MQNAVDRLCGCVKISARVCGALCWALDELPCDSSHFKFVFFFVISFLIFRLCRWESLNESESKGKKRAGSHFFFLISSFVCNFRLVYWCHSGRWDWLCVPALLRQKKWRESNIIGQFTVASETENSAVCTDDVQSRRNQRSVCVHSRTKRIKCAELCVFTVEIFSFNFNCWVIFAITAWLRLIDFIFGVAAARGSVFAYLRTQAVNSRFCGLRKIENYFAVRPCNCVQIRVSGERVHKV